MRLSDTEKRQLKYCPFCGGDLEQLEAVQEQDITYIHCNQCGSMGPDKYQMPDAMRAWNKRVTVQA